MKKKENNNPFPSDSVSKWVFIHIKTCSMYSFIFMQIKIAASAQCPAPGTGCPALLWALICSLRCLRLRLQWLARCNFFSFGLIIATENCSIYEHSDSLTFKQGRRHFHIKGFAWSLLLKKSHKVTRKWFAAWLDG